MCIAVESDPAITQIARGDGWVSNKWATHTAMSHLRAAVCIVVESDPAITQIARDNEWISVVSSTYTVTSHLLAAVCNATPSHAVIASIADENESSERQGSDTCREEPLTSCSGQRCPK